MTVEFFDQSFMSQSILFMVIVFPLIKVETETMILLEASSSLATVTLMLSRPANLDFRFCPLVFKSCSALPAVKTLVTYKDNFNEVYVHNN